MSSLLADRPPFWVKAAIAVALIVAGDVLLFRDTEGANVGLLLLAFTAAAAVHPDLRRNRLGRTALVAAGALAMLQIEHVTALGWLLFWTALGVAVLAGRAAPGDGAWPWAQRLVVHGLKSLIGPLIDLHELGRAKDTRTLAGLKAVPLTVAMPLIGAAIFVWLFAVANPLIGDWFAAWRLPAPDIGRILFWGFIGMLAWGTLRPRDLKKTLATPDARTDLVLPGVTAASVTLSLIVFNAVFALQNTLDIAFLWNGAKLPLGMTFAGYAHRGAYPLIATALLAGLFVLVFLRPGSETAQRPLVRGLVATWIAQNLFLVASTVLRTLDYVDAYSLTRMRIAALIWMGLVAVGLGLVGWRLLRDRSAAWLINANAAALGVVLAACSVADLGSMAAAWNVSHAREVGGRGVGLDVCYLGQIGQPAMVSLAELERQPLSPELRQRVAGTRARLLQDARARQTEWRSWTWREARRLARTEAVTQPFPASRICAPAAPAPLTPSAKP